MREAEANLSHNFKLQSSYNYGNEQKDYILIQQVIRSYIIIVYATNDIVHFLILKGS